MQISSVVHLGFNDKLPFGKYKGAFTITEILQRNAKYLLWFRKVAKYYKFDAEVNKHLDTYVKRNRRGGSNLEEDDFNDWGNALNDDWDSVW